jgi:hypothetical protein
MSDGHSFTQSESLSNQERISELERKIPILQNNISQVDQLTSKLDSLSNVLIGVATDVSAALKKVKELELQISIIAQSHTKLEADVSFNDEKAKSHMVDIVAAIHKVAQESGARQELLDKQFQEYKSSQEPRIGMKADKPEIEALTQFVKTSISQYTSTFADQIIDIANRVSAFTGMINQQIGKYVCSDDMNTMKKDILEIVTTGYELLREALKETKNDLNGNISQLNEKISLNSQKSDENSPNFDTLRQEFDKKMQNVALDAQNATLRTQNSDQKITTLERRIENLDLRLKKSELQE